MVFFELLDEEVLLLDWLCGLDDCTGGGASTMGTCVLSSADELTGLDSGIKAGSLAASTEDDSLVSAGRLSLGVSNMNFEVDSWVVIELVLDVAELLLVFNNEELFELML